MEQFIDVSNEARDAGFTCPVLIDRHVWDRCVKWTTADNDRQGYQEENARLWNVLHIPSMKLQFAIENGHNEVDLFKPDGLLYDIFCLLRGEGKEAAPVTLRVSPVVLDGNVDGLIISFST